MAPSEGFFVEPRQGRTFSEPFQVLRSLTGLMFRGRAILRPYAPECQSKSPERMMRSRPSGEVCGSGPASWRLTLKRPRMPSGDADNPVTSVQCGKSPFHYLPERHDASRSHQLPSPQSSATSSTSSPRSTASCVREAVSLRRRACAGSAAICKVSADPAPPRSIFS